MIRKIIALALAVPLLAFAACTDDDGDAPTTPTTATTATVAATTEATAATPAPDVSEPAPGVTDTEVVVGAHAPLSGPGAATAGVHQAIGAYFEYFNDTEGGVNGRALRYDVRDDQLQAADARIATQELIEQVGVFAFLGAAGTAGHLAAIELINEAGLPDIMAISSFPGFADASVNPNTFRAVASGGEEATVLAEYLNANLPEASAAILYQNDDFGRPYQAGFTRTFAGELVGEATFEATSADVSSQIALLLEDDPTAIMVACLPTVCANAIRSARDAGSDALFLLSAPGGIDALAQLAGGPQNVEGTIVPALAKTIGLTAAPAVQAHIEIMEGQGLEPSNFTIFGQVIAQVFIDILERAGDPPTHAGFLEAALDTNLELDLALAPITFSATDRVALEAGRLWRAENGRFVPFTVD